MATITATPLDAPARRQLWRWRRARAASASAGRQAAAMVSAARHHNWSPALTISGLGCGTISAWETFGRGAAWATAAAAIFIIDWSRDR